MCCPTQCILSFRAKNNVHLFVFVAALVCIVYWPKIDSCNRKPIDDVDDSVMSSAMAWCNRCASGVFLMLKEHRTSKRGKKEDKTKPILIWCKLLINKQQHTIMVFIVALMPFFKITFFVEFFFFFFFLPSFVFHLIRRFLFSCHKHTGYWLCAQGNRFTMNSSQIETRVRKRERKTPHHIDCKHFRWRALVHSMRSYQSKMIIHLKCILWRHDRIFNYLFGFNKTRLDNSCEESSKFSPIIV